MGYTELIGKPLWFRDSSGDSVVSPAGIYKEHVLDTEKLKILLPGGIYRELKAQMEKTRVLDKQLADVIAHATKEWALSHGATHFTHKFQSLSGCSAEKHDSFLDFSRQSFNELGVPEPINMFTGSQLLQSEPDASSFPSGGMRSIFEARGYTIWDTSSFMYLSSGPHGTKTLCIPSIFISYDGKILDEKTVLLKSEKVLSQASLRVLRLLGDKKVKSVKSVLGTEQEFFLIEESVYKKRPDLRMTGGTVYGILPPKSQQLRDHYSKLVPEKVLAVIDEAQVELYKLGVPIKTRHSEVAPNQFEVAPIHEASAKASDHNTLTMEIIAKVAPKYGLVALYNEKPFAGVNGSGKHCNWSICTDSNENLLLPGPSPKTNFKFLLFFLATLDALNNHGEILLASITTSTNRHRLGAAEAPPGVISAFLGSYLDDVLNSLEAGSDLTKTLSRVEPSSGLINVELSCMPKVPRDLTDRNRTSPFAFTGNRFEFRAVGSKQFPAFPITLLNSAVSASLNKIADDIDSAKGEGEASNEIILNVIRKYIASSKPIRFEGNNYAKSWVEEARKRGIPISKDNFIENYDYLIHPKHFNMLVGMKVFTEEELISRRKVAIEKYGREILIEAGVIVYMVKNYLAPGLRLYMKELVDHIKCMEQNSPCAGEKEILTQCAKISDKLHKDLSALDTLRKELESCDEEDLHENVPEIASVQNHIDTLRETCNSAEEILPAKYHNVPGYYDIFFP